MKIEHLFDSLATALAWSQPFSAIFVFAKGMDRNRARTIATSRLSGSICGTYAEMSAILDGMPTDSARPGVVIDVDALPYPDEDLLRILDKIAQMPITVCVLSSYKHRDLCRHSNSWERRSGCFDFIAASL